MDKYQQVARAFKAFCDENRVRILELLTTGEKCACQLLDELQITQPTLSHHMKILCDSGVVSGRKDGKWMYYSLSDDGVENVKALFNTYTKLNTVAECKPCCEK